MAMLCDCFKFNAPADPKYRLLAIYCKECNAKYYWQLVDALLKGARYKLLTIIFFLETRIAETAKETHDWSCYFYI